jgi:hypothetical protein
MPQVHRNRIGFIERNPVFGVLAQLAVNIVVHAGKQGGPEDAVHIGFDGVKSLAGAEGLVVDADGDEQRGGKASAPPAFVSGKNKNRKGNERQQSQDRHW